MLLESTKFDTLPILFFFFSIFVVVVFLVFFYSLLFKKKKFNDLTVIAFPGRQ